MLVSYFETARYKVPPTMPAEWPVPPAAYDPGAGAQAYQGDLRFDRIYSITGELVYKLARDLWVRGTLRRDILDSNQPGSSSAATVAMLGVRLQN